MHYSPNNLNIKSPLLLSLFCGAGGLDIGFEKSGFDVGLSFDIRSDSIASYNKNRANKSGHVYNVRDLTLEKLDEFYGREFKPIGIIGGPPCQGFSVSNVHQSESDQRNTLSFSYADLLQKLNERSRVHFFVFENVKGLLGGKHSGTFKKIKSRFRKAGFTIYPFILNAKNFGTPQHRERLIIVGFNKQIYSKLDFSIPPMLNGYDNHPITVKKAIGSLPEPVFFANVTDKDAIPYHPNHWCMTPRSYKFHTEGVLKPGVSFGRSFRTLHWNEPSPTVAYGNQEVHVHPTGKRRLSVHEAMLLQGFPTDYILKGTLSQQFTQVSEAVAPPLAEIVAKTIMLQLEWT